MNLKNKIIFLFSLSLILSSLLSINPIQADSEETFIVWVVTDPEADETTGAISDWWWDAVNDSNNFDWDICLVLGDTIDYPNNHSYMNFTKWRNDSVKGREYFYCFPGNHEGQTDSCPDYEGYFWRWVKYIDPKGQNETTSFVNNLNRPFNISNATDGALWGDTTRSPDDGQMRYALHTHNICWLMMGVNINISVGTSANTYPYFNWWKSHVENNSDGIVIACTHHPLENSGIYASTPILQSSSYENYLDDSSDMLVDIWLNGHHHYMTGRERLVYNTESNEGGKEMNTTFMSPSSVTGDKGQGSYSYIFTFTNGSDQVDVAEYRHDTNQWDVGIPGNVTLNLSTAFLFTGGESGSSDDIQFISIEGSTNGSMVYTGTPTINWTVADDCYQYWLQIATDSDFISLEANYMDVNEVNYPLNCDINDTRVSFVLPDRLDSDVYYMRVRACYR